jgi:hypothetical protein
MRDESHSERRVLSETMQIGHELGDALIPHYARAEYTDPVVVIGETVPWMETAAAAYFP